LFGAARDTGAHAELLSTNNTQKAIQFGLFAQTSNILDTTAVLNEQRTSGAWAVLAAAAIWGTVGPAQLLSGTSADPGALGAARLIVGGVVLSAPLIGRARWGALSSRASLPWVLVAAVSTALYQATFLYAVDRAGAALGTTVALGCAPFATGTFAWWWLRQRPDWRWIAGTLAAVTGCALVLSSGGGARVDPVGVAFAVVSGCCYGAYTVAAKIFLGSGVPQMVTVASTLLLGGLLLSPLIVVHHAHLLDAPTVALVGWMGAIATAFAYALFIRGLARTTASAAGTLSLAEPLAAAVLGVLVLHERLTTNATVGAITLLLGLVVVVLPHRVAVTPAPELTPAAEPAVPR
jgi:DME family drug/metabolite transporter